MMVAGLSAFSGITFSARIETSLSTLGNGMELRAITACVLGGASINGGQGSVLGAVIGTLFVGVINNLMIIGKINTYWQQVVTGTILLTAVVLDAVLHLKRSE
jgi:ribose transport system permease protein